LNWSKLFEMQRNLDAYITENHQLENEPLFEPKILALLVELGELANETRCFKFWSTKKGAARDVILEEYVDNIHFLLSLGIEKGYEFETIETKDTTKNETEQFNDVFRLAIKFYDEQSETTYKQLVENYIQLAKVLGFSEQDIMKAYIEKNEVNYERQKSGY